ncbi:hypothetical protein [Erwinia psidii]|nr:hypothetical protein [Erwinia psidii]
MSDLMLVSHNMSYHSTFSALYKSIFTGGDGVGLWIGVKDKRRS